MVRIISRPSSGPNLGRVSVSTIKNFERMSRDVVVADVIIPTVLEGNDYIIN